MLGVQSGSRSWASASATVSSGPRMMISGVSMPPAVPSSYDSRRDTTSASSSSIASRIARALLDRHLVQQVGEVVVLHLVEHVDDAIEVEPLDQPQLFLLGQLLEQVGEAVVVHRRRQLPALRQRQGAHHAGDVATGACRAGGRPRRRPRSAPPRARAPRATRRAGSWSGGAASCAVTRRTVATSQRRTRPSSTSRSPMSLTVSPRTVRSMTSAAISFSPGRALERVQIDVPAAQADAVVVDPGDPRRVDEDPPALAAGDETDDPGRGAGATGHDDDVDDLADLGPAGVEQWQAHHPECVDHLACHTGETTRPPCSEAAMNERHGAG